VREPARLIDVFPTVLALLGLPVPPDVQGRPLLPSPGDGEREVYAETYYPRLHMGWSELAALIRGDHHYIEAPDPELYDLASDPRETRNLVTTQRRLFAALRADLAPYRAELARPAEASPETLAKLTALGYVGAANAAREGPLPDPKSEIHTLEDFKTAAQLMARQQWTAAIPLLERTLEGSPRMQDAWERLVLCLGRSGRRVEALAAQRRALENSGGAAQPALALAGMLLQVGRADEARAHAELALAGAPGLAHRLLAEIALEARDLVEAERRARAGVAEDPDQPASLLLLVQVLGRRGSLEEAGEVMAAAERAAAASATFPPGFHLARGDLAARRGRAAEARRDFEEEIRRNPEVLDAHARLAALQAAQGESLAAWKTLQRMVELNHDSPAAYGSAVETLRVLGDGETAARLLRHARRLHPGDPYLREMGGG
jgi:tetratricopeptide (TPR) repeat protein